MVDLDGKRELSQVIFLKRVDSKLKVYPTVFTDFVFINNKEKNPIDIVVFDNSGRPVKKMFGAFNQLDLSDIPAGQYWIKIQESNEPISHCKKICKF